MNEMAGRKTRFSVAAVLSLMLVFSVFIGAEPVSAATSGDFKYDVLNGNATITRYAGGATNLEIPSTLGGYPVTNIGNSAFRDSESLTTVTIPNGVTSIGDFAFNHCTSLADITIPDSVTSIGDSAFWACALTTITIPDSVTSIGDGAFVDCHLLTTITIPDSVTSIGEGAFQYCYSLTTITIPDSVTSIGKDAFLGSNYLTIRCYDGSYAYTYAIINKIPYAFIGDSIASENSGINVQYHSQAYILKYVQDNNISLTAQTTYAKTPKTTAPYDKGAVSQTSLNDALKTLNLMRYIAGIDADVTLNSEYNEEAQAASLVNYVNDGGLSHTPSRPANMDDALYSLGYTGASSSNLGMGFNNIQNSIVRGYMEDSDSSNIDRVGHRRWILNPAMKATGFGFVENSTALYAHDTTRERTPYYGIAWPAQTMPLEYFGDYTAWSFSAGSLIRGDVDASSVKVTLTRTSDKKTWTFSKASSNGYFNVDNGSYGSGSCIIFRPDNITYKAGDKFDVTISGVTEEDIKYSVSFFNLSGWKKQTNGTWQYQINGVAQTGWDEIDYKWYHFTSTGIMDSGWKKLSNSWYYFGGANDGVMKTGWQKISGKWYYFGYENDGRMKTGWQTIGGKRYYFGGANDGAMKSGWQTIGGKRYYFGGANDGKLRA